MDRIRIHVLGGALVLGAFCWRSWELGGMGQSRGVE